MSPRLTCAKPEQLQRFDHREQLVHVQVFLVGELRQIGAAVIGRLGQPLDQARELLHGRVGQTMADADRLRLGAASPVAARHRRQQRVDLIDDLPERRAFPIARPRQRHPDLGGDAARDRCRRSGCGRPSRPPPRYCATPAGCPWSGCAAAPTTRSDRCAESRRSARRAARTARQAAGCPGSTTSARANPTRCRMPPDSSFG